MSNVNNRSIGVSVVIPTYNRPDYLERILRCISCQTRKVNEVIVINDNSDNLDEYDRVIEAFRNKMEIQYIVNEKNMGAPYSRNLGIEKSRYCYLALTDDDDEWENDKIEKQFAVMQSGNYGLLYTYGIAVDEEGKEIYRFGGQENNLKSLLKKNFIPSSSVMVSYEAIFGAGMFDLQMPSCQDWDMWIRIISSGYAFKGIEEPLVIYHRHGKGSIGTGTKVEKGYRLYYRKHLRKYIRFFLFSKDFKIALYAVRMAVHKV